MGKNWKKIRNITKSNQSSNGKYVFDMWIKEDFPQARFERYTDDRGIAVPKKKHSNSDINQDSSMTNI